MHQPSCTSSSAQFSSSINNGRDYVTSSLVDRDIRDINLSTESPKEEYAWVTRQQHPPSSFHFVNGLCMLCYTEQRLDLYS